MILNNRMIIRCTLIEVNIFWIDLMRVVVKKGRKVKVRSVLILSHMVFMIRMSSRKNQLFSKLTLSLQKTVFHL